MNNKTYHRMTKKRPLRGFKLFTLKYLTWEHFCSLCAKLRLLRTHYVSTSERVHVPTIEKVNIVEDKIITSRGEFKVSYCGEAFNYVHEKWYESRIFKRKDKPFIYCLIENSRGSYFDLNFRAECVSFLVKIDPIHDPITLTRKMPDLRVLTPAPTISPYTEGNAIEPLKTRLIHGDFLKARYALSIHSDLQPLDENIKEVLQTGMVRLENDLEARSVEINERLTGVNNDGEFMSPDGNSLVPNTVCKRCGCPVFFSSVDEYKFQCLNHDEDLYEIEVERLDPIQYKHNYDNWKERLYLILSEND